MSKLSRSPTFGVIVSKKFGCPVPSEKGCDNATTHYSSDPVLVGTTESQRQIVDGLFLTRKRTSELFRVLETEI